MQQGRTILSRRNTKSKCGILKVCLDAFSSKRSHTEFYTNNYKQSRSIGFSRFAFTGKEKDEETGYGYYGARYMDHELMTSWLSVDPMSDKYPSISPYAYCAWNPVKLVDPDGREINVSALSESMQQRLVNCLGYITGLNLAVENGLLVSKGERTEKYLFSKSARKDLLDAIGNQEKKVYVCINRDANKDDHSVDLQGRNWIRLGSFHQEEYDKSTNGLGMLFFHELGHTYFGDEDPPIYEHTEYTKDDGLPYPSFKNGESGVGEAVRRVNRYRREMDLPIRRAYEECDIKGYEGKIPFEGTFRWKNDNGKEKKWKGTQYLFIR